eukprot:m.341625 g.341625  ORF g.341625 m.341625 type:complete len:78 (+) comp20282_c0_seq1:2208-2441(+)
MPKDMSRNGYIRRQSSNVRATRCRVMAEASQCMFFSCLYGLLFAIIYPITDLLIPYVSHDEETTAVRCQQVALHNSH